MTTSADPTPPSKPSERFRRDAAVSATVMAVPSPSDPGPVRVAYAIRWLELGDERIRPRWEDWTSGRGRESRSVEPAQPTAQRNGEMTT